MLPLRYLAVLLTVAMTLGVRLDAQDLSPEESFASLDQLMELRVQTATLAKQTLRDAPADVSVITAAEIRRYGYRTLGEVLSNVRGFYITHDSSYQYAGVRGFSMLGDYNTRFLVLIDGHTMTDNVFGAMYMFGQDFPLDLDLVEQIEIVRGPSSALYGSNGMFATINILTKKAGLGRSGRVSTELGSFGEKKVLTSGSFTFGGSGSALISASGFYSAGRKTNLNGLANVDGSITVNGVGAERGLHTFANISWKNWNIVALFGERGSNNPTGYFGADIGDNSTETLDGRNFLEVAWSKSISDTRSLKWRAYYDSYRYDALYQYTKSQGTENLDGVAGDWIGQQLVYKHRFSRFGSLTLGAETSVDLQNMQYNFDVDTEDEARMPLHEFRLKHPNAGYAVFAQHEWNIGPRFTLYTGARLDDSKNNQLFVSPRLALIYKRAEASYKLMYGRAFRNPSTFERYWEPNPDLLGERMSTIEFSREQVIRKRLTLVTSVFHYALRDLIAGVAISDNYLQYRNTSKASASGAEVEINGRPATWLHAGGSLTVQRTQGSESGRNFQNSPARVGQLRAAFPIWRERFTPSLAFRHLSSRTNAYENIIPSATLVDVTATSRVPSKGLDLQFGVRNVFDKRYSDPLSTEHAAPLFPRAGRTFFVKLTWQSE